MTFLKIVMPAVKTWKHKSLWFAKAPILLQAEAKILTSTMGTKKEAKQQTSVIQTQKRLSLEMTTASNK